jgi:IS605 OrfB family transposase
MIKEALKIIVENDVRSVKRAHELCYGVLREKYPSLHNKFAQEAYKRALAMYRSYRKLLNKWKRLPEKKREKISPPSLPSIEGNRVIELHISTYRLERRHGFLMLTVSIGDGDYLRFLVMEYSYASRELSGAKLGNSKIVVGENGVYLHLTIRKNVEVNEHKNKLFIDVNEDSVDCLLVDYDKNRAVLFSIKHDIRSLRVNYRRIRRSIQTKVENHYLQRRLLAKYGSRERRRVEDRLKKVVALLAEIGRYYNADLVREDLKDLNLNRKRGNGQLNYRLSSLPYRKLVSYIDHKFNERGLNVSVVDAKKTSITCPVCGYADKANRVDRDSFKCRKCGFAFNAQYVACLNLFSRLNDGKVAIRGGRLYLVSRKAGSVVPVYVALDDPTISGWVPRGKPMPIKTKVIQVAKAT